MKDQALYLEADEDITSAIDKLVKASGQTVQIVVPKRSALLQSIINLKLLKKAAADNGKELVLVTTDKVAGDLAARLGLAVAPALGAVAVHGDAAPAPRPPVEDIIEADDPIIEAVPEPATKPPKSLPKKPAFFNRKPLAEAVPIVAADIAAETPAATDEPVTPEVGAISAKVPNFGKLQRRLAWVGGALALIIAYFVWMAVYAKADITLFATGTKVAVDTSFAVDTNQTSTNPATGVLAGQIVTFAKDLTGAVTPTGQQDVGTKSSGTMTISNCLDASSHTFPTGTKFTAPDGKVFVSGADVTVPGGQGGFTGCTTPGSASVKVTADQNGDSYNEAPAGYTISSLTAAQQTGPNSIKAKGSQMSGGTSKVVTVVAQADVDKTQSDLLAKDKDDSLRTLDSHVPSGYLPIGGSSAITASNVAPTPAVGQPATTASLTLHVTYTELASKKTDYQALLSLRELNQVGSKNQIYDDGLSAAQVTTAGKDTSGRPQFHLSTQAYSGAKLNVDALAAQMAGRKYGDANNIATSQPGVQRATIILSPAWSTSLPHNTRKIKITIQVASAAS
jgi:hypothetical protein